MRTSLYLLVCAAALTAPTSGHAGITLEYWSGVQDFTPYNPPSPSSLNPQTIEGLRNWNFTGQTKLNSLSVPSGSQYVVKVVLRDHDSVGNGTGYTLSGDGTFNNAYGLQTFAFRFGYAPGVLSATRDVNLTDGKAPTVTVWAGNGAAPTSTQENMNFTSQDFGSNYYTVGGLFWNTANMNAIAPFQQTNGDVLYPLANVLLTAGSTGTGVLSLTKPTTPGPTFATVYGSSPGTLVSYDNALWGSNFGTLASLSFTVTPAPEPSSLLLGGLVVSAVGYQRRRSRRKCA